MSETHTYEFNVTMTCGGCSGAIDRVLKKLEGTFLNNHSPLSSPLLPSLSPSLSSVMP
jgi:copper chaperone CopZ